MEPAAGGRHEVRGGPGGQRGLTAAGTCPRNLPSPAPARDGKGVPPPGQPKPLRMELLDEFDSEFPQCDLLPAHPRGGLREASGDLHWRARCASSSLASTATRRWMRGWCARASRRSQGLVCRPGGAELLQQHGRPGDAPAPGAAQEAHPPRALILPGCQEEEKQAKTEETRTHLLVGRVDLPVPATNPAATACHYHGLHGGPINLCLHSAQGLWPLPSAAQHIGFHFSYLARNNAHKLHCPGFPGPSACSASASTEEMLSPSVKASIFTPPVLLKFQPVPRPKDESENDPGRAESTPHQRDP
ncbi:uncharacterized protein [Phocoena phocoena]|uniref:uncharacterized protein n=1 Tax=Phocoena phocoena TaxID=9742 RepID=UPI003306ADE4